MGRCEYCKLPRNKSSGLSYHRFPENSELKSKWIENMGRIDWAPKQYSVLCSLHFEKSCFDFRDFRWRLRKGSVPTMFKHNKEDNIDPASSDNFLSLDEGTEIFIGEQMDIIDESTDIQDQGEITFPEEQRANVIHHDHVYNLSPDLLVKQLAAAQSKVKRLTKENQALRQKAKLAKQSIKSLKEIIQHIVITQKKRAVILVAKPEAAQ